jgi:hypothetical protein
MECQDAHAPPTSRATAVMKSSDEFVVNLNGRENIPLKDYLENAMYMNPKQKFLKASLLMNEAEAAERENENEYWNCIPKKILNRLWSIPQLRNHTHGKKSEVERVGEEESDEEESPVSWTELFYDLIFVASISNVAEALKEIIEFHAVLEMWLLLLYWIMFMQTWSTFMFYLSRFKNTDIFSNFIFFIYNSGIVVMAANLIAGLSDRKSCSIGYAITRLAACILYAQVSLNPEAKILDELLRLVILFAL